MKLRALSSRLITWFNVNARDLPWRRTLDPYAIWVSEIMLQQTQVRTVIPYWERWMGTLPDVHALASVEESRLLKLWEGLGYYRRARLLQRAAKVLIESDANALPKSLDSLMELPGIGRYTAGAIASIAFNQPAPILDGNVIRVLTRLFAIRGDPKDSPVNEALWQLAGELIHAAASLPANFAPTEFRDMKFSGVCSMLNQSLMELGALVCQPVQPQCDKCPLSSKCEAHKLGISASLPANGKRQQSVHRMFAAFVVQRQGKFLVRQREASSVNGGLWEFPNAEAGGEDGDAVASAAGSLNLDSQLQEPLLVIRHSITRYRMELRVFNARRVNASRGLNDNERWMSREDLAKAAFSSAHRKIADHLSQSVRKDITQSKALRPGCSSPPAPKSPPADRCSSMGRSRAQGQ